MVVKKAAAKKTAPVKRSSSPKPDMPKLMAIFGQIKKLMKRYEPPLNARVDIEGKYDLWSEKTIQAYGREYAAMSFATIIIQSGYVGFYFMPVYSCPDMKKAMKPELLKLLKGKACFHVKSIDDETEAQLKDALHKGFKKYKELGWV